MKRTFIILLAAFGCVCATCKKTEVPPAETLQSAASFPMGASVSGKLLQENAAYRNVVATEHNSVTAENAMKMNRLHPAADRYDFIEADYIVDFARSQGRKRVHGHTLVWHSFGDIGWVKNFQGDSAAWENLLKTHIQTVAKHFKDKVASWDVVNEAFHDDGTLRVEDKMVNDKKSEGSIWARKLGRDYMARAFRYAHEADPAALLFYNDYGQEYSPSKVKAIEGLVADFKRRGVPIHGIGLQMHTSLNASNDGIANALRRLAATGLKVHISELDVLVSNWRNDPDLVFTDALKQAQREKYKFIAAAYRDNVPAAQRYGITNWNVGDADSWIRSFVKIHDWPLPFDDNYQRKPAYYGLLEGLK